MFLVLVFWRLVFPRWCFLWRELPRKRGRTGSAKGSGGSFAKTCFALSVGVWSARTGKKDGFLIACFAFSDSELSAHNRSVVGSSPASATRSSSRNGFRYDYFFVLVRYLLSYYKNHGFAVAFYNEMEYIKTYLTPYRGRGVVLVQESLQREMHDKLLTR